MFDVTNAVGASASTCALAKITVLCLVGEVKMLSQFRHYETS